MSIAASNVEGAVPVPTRSWLWRRGPKRLTGSVFAEPLFLHHVAKTGGTRLHAGIEETPTAPH